MIDPHLLRDDPDRVRRAVAAKGGGLDVDRLIALEAGRRELTGRIDELNRQRNEKSRAIGPLVQAGRDASAIKAEVKALKEALETAEAEARRLEADFEALLLRVPNPPHPWTPPGRTAEDNRIVKHWGEPPAFDFEPQPHWVLGERLGILDLPAAAKLAGSGFYVLRGAGARLERALINWMLDLHVAEHGYTEIQPPHLVTSPVMTGTGQLPKMAEDMYRLEGEDLWLIPTAEVPLTNLHREEILEPDRLPLRYCAYTPCFRREAGSYGKEVRGITRVHQFDKVELVQIVSPEASDEALESLTRHAETLLERLGLAYRRVELCAADLSFASGRTYDLEVWAPGMGLWLEVSSCSNFGDFQARRCGLRYRPAPGAKPRFPHTLNGSGLALPRTVIALLETYQDAAGAVRLPPPLRAALGADTL